MTPTGPIPPESAPITFTPGDFPRVNPAHWMRYVPPWSRPYRLQRIAAQQASNANFSQITLFNNGVNRFIVIIGFSFIQPPGGFVGVSNLGAGFGTPAAVPQPVVPGEARLGAGMGTNTPAAAPPADFVFGINTSAGYEWNRPEPFSLLQPGVGIAFTSGAVTQNLYGSFLLGWADPSELNWNFKPDDLAF